MAGRRTVAALVAGVALAGCGTSAPEGPDPSGQVQTLWSARSAYVGDNSKMVALVQEVGFGADHPYRLALQTTTPPYAVTVALTRLEKPFANTDFNENATLLLGLVANLEKVSVTLGNQAYTLTAAQASKELGYDVKELGRDRSRLAAYVEASRD